MLKNACLPSMLLLLTASANAADKPAAETDPVARVRQLTAQGFPVVDYHAHLKGGLTLDELLAHGKKTGIRYGVAPNCGKGFPITTDEGVHEFIKSMRGKGVLLGMQAEGREWVTMFSQEAVAEFDYVFSDAMTFTDHRGKRVRLWIKEEVDVPDRQAFMDLLLGKIVGILDNEPIDIYVNPTFLPEAIAKDYDALWTKPRMQRVIDAAVRNGVAIEINARYRLPSPAFIKLAKSQGAKFSFGTNNGDRDLGTLDYCLEMVKECGLTPADMFAPKPDGKKPVQVRGFKKVTARTYRVGILGFGFIGKVHAYGYLNLPLFYDPPPLRAKITHVVTGRQETSEKACRTIGADVAATDFRAVTENPDIDIVHVCMPNHLHREALLSAMRQQKHIYCDKPLVATWAEAEEIAAALTDYRGTAQMTFQNRFVPATLRAKQLVAAGALGEVLEFRANYLHGGSANPDAPLKWKLTAAAGGGVIADLASHVLDLVEHLLGPLQSLSAATHIAYGQRPACRATVPAARAGETPAPQRPLLAVDAEDSVMLLARLVSGALGTIGATKLATGSEDELRLDIHGSLGALRFNLMDPHHLEFYDATLPDGPSGGLRGWNRIDTGQRYAPPATGFPSPKAAVGWIRSHVACLANFLQAVADGRPAAPGLDQGIRVQRLMDLRPPLGRRSVLDRRTVKHALFDPVTAA